MKRLITFLILLTLPVTALGQAGYSSYRVYNSFSNGVINTGTADKVPIGGLFDAENVTLDRGGSIKERLGTAQFADTISGARRILGFHAYYKSTTGVHYPMMAFNDDIYIEGSGTWSAQSQSLTADLEGNFLDAFDKTYYNNGTDDTRIYDGNSMTTDANFKKGVIMAFYENRIIVAVANLMWFSDLGVTTFQSSSYVDINDRVTGLLAGDYYLYIFTESDIYRIARFEHYDGIVFGPNAMEKMPCHIGTVAHRSLVKIKNKIYTLTREGVYRIEGGGIQAARITEECEAAFEALDPDYLAGSSGAAFDDKYFLAVRETGKSYNNKILVFDTQLGHHREADPHSRRVPAFVPYTYIGATLYPEVLTIIPTSTGKKRLMFGDGLTGRTFQMETGTNDNGSAIISYAIKPLLNDVMPDLIKRLMKVQITAETLGSYDLLVAFKNDEYSGYSDERKDLTAGGATWGTGVWGTFVWGAQTTKRLFLTPNVKGYYLLIRMKNDQADEPWEVSRIGCMFRARRRYQPLRTP